MTKRTVPIAWLPVDSRIFGSFLSFGHVHGVTKLFLQLEIILSVAVVAGTIAMVLLRLAL